MLEPIEIARACEEFTRNTNIIITDGAKRQILQLINSVGLDPHETWQPDPPARALDQYYKRWRGELQDVLEQIATDHRIETRITTIDVAYWTGHNLESIWQRMCPFPDGPEIPPTVMFVFPWKLK
jgi:hypothetical protein